MGEVRMKVERKQQPSDLCEEAGIAWAPGHVSLVPTFPGGLAARSSHS